LAPGPPGWRRCGTARSFESTPPSGRSREVCSIVRSVILARRGAPCPEFAQGVAMLEMELPTHHDWKTAENTYGKLVIESFEPGLALTVGNAYRRGARSPGPSCAPPPRARERVP